MSEGNVIVYYSGEWTTSAVRGVLITYNDNEMTISGTQSADRVLNLSDGEYTVYYI